MHRPRRRRQRAGERGPIGRSRIAEQIPLACRRIQHGRRCDGPRLGLIGGTQGQLRGSFFRPRARFNRRRTARPRHQRPPTAAAGDEEQKQRPERPAWVTTFKTHPPSSSGGDSLATRLPTKTDRSQTEQIAASFFARGGRGHEASCAALPAHLLARSPPRHLTTSATHNLPRYPIVGANLPAAKIAPSVTNA